MRRLCQSNVLSQRREWASQRRPTILQHDQRSRSLDTLNVVQELKTKDRRAPSARVFVPVLKNLLGMKNSHEIARNMDVLNENPAQGSYRSKLFKYSRKSLLSSGRLRANSTVAFRNPSLSPAS
jgi:hypothetical protein